MEIQRFQPRFYGRQSKTPSDGFTLIELMLVAAIIGLLAAIAIPRFADLVDRAREASLKGAMGALRSALSIYYADNESLYPKYGVPFVPPALGLLHLDGKYIDLNRIVFTIPRYQKNNGHSSSGGLSISAKTLYNFMGTQFQAMGPPRELANWVDQQPFPIYSTWSQNAIARTEMAEILIPCWHRDLRGVVWSEQ